ncbi:hypothetical protein EXIGLDRAFT_571865, partial [Exidia glandulosa HHB12029]
ALHYCAYTNTISCSGDSFCCDDGGAVCCGPWPTAWGWSAQFENLPAGTQGQGYTGSACVDFNFVVFGPGTQCHKSGGGTRVTHINWFHSPTGKRSNNETETQECATPSSFQYEDDHGVQHVIKISSKEEVEIIGKHALEKNYAALSTF